MTCVCKHTNVSHGHMISAHSSLQVFIQTSIFSTLRKYTHMFTNPNIKWCIDNRSTPFAQRVSTVLSWFDFIQEKRLLRSFI